MGEAVTARVGEVVPDVLAAVHDVLERHEVTEQEWHAVLSFLTEVGRADEFVLLSDVTRTSVLIDALSHGADEPGATASDVEGPMYRDEPPWRTKIYEVYEGMGEGDVLLVRGTVKSTGGEPLPDAVVDVWQTGPNGYDFWDPRQPENNFRGRMRVEAGGDYEFETMVPTPYTVPDDGPVGRYLEAIDQHPWRPDPGLLPGRPVPGERHHRGGEAGAHQAARAGGRASRLPVRYRAAAGRMSTAAAPTSRPATGAR
jgi:hypothetical protein